MATGNGLVQAATAAATLAAFERPVPVTLVLVSQNWQKRQKVQYEAIKGLAKEDFHSLDDFTFQMDLLMKAGPIAQQLAWKLLKPAVKLQAKLMTKLLIDPQMGVVGRYLRLLVGFTILFLSPVEILSGKSSLKAQ